MLFRGKKKHQQDEKVDPEEERLLERARGVESPILILDERWLQIFPNNYKTREMKQLEKELREAFIYQAKLTSEMESAESTKKQLMERIIRFMSVAQVSAEEAKKQEKSQEYIRNLNEQLDDMELEYEQMPERIKELNQELLVESLRACYRKMRENSQDLREEKAEIRELKELLLQHEERKEQLEKENERMFRFMHRIYGRGILEVFDEFDDDVEGEVE